MINKIKNYDKPFQITENIGNNIFCFDKVKNPIIHIPSLIQTSIEEFSKNIDNYLKIGENITFREEKDGKIIGYKGLKNFINIKGENQTIYIIDNHNHALYFRYKEYFAGNIQKGSELIHIDQHTDMNDNKYKISFSPVKRENRSEIIFDFTNHKCNVGNFIKPAVEEGLIGDIIQISTEYSLLGKRESLFAPNHNTFTLDIDLDFRAPEMSIEKYNQTIEITKRLIQNSRVVTIATSPYFLDQAIAIKTLKDLFK